MEELGIFPLSTSFEDLKSAEFVSHDHSYANKPDAIAQCEGDFPPEVEQAQQRIAANQCERDFPPEVEHPCEENCQTGVEQGRDRIAANQFEGDFQIEFEQPREPDVVNQCVDSVNFLPSANTWKRTSASREQ